MCPAFPRNMAARVSREGSQRHNNAFALSIVNFHLLLCFLTQNLRRLLHRFSFPRGDRQERDRDEAKSLWAFRFPHLHLLFRLFRVQLGPVVVSKRRTRTSCTARCTRHGWIFVARYWSHEKKTSSSEKEFKWKLVDVNHTRSCRRMTAVLSESIS